MPEEYVIALIVEGDSAFPDKLRLVVEEDGQHPRDRVAQPRREVVQDHLWPVSGYLTKIALQNGKTNIKKYTFDAFVSCEIP